MLHFESRKGCAQGYRALAFIGGILLALNISACKQETKAAEAQISEEEQKANTFYQQNAKEAQLQLLKQVGTLRDTAFIDRMGYGYYRNGGKWKWMGAPGQLAICDALDSLLHSQIDAIGFSGKYFGIDEIDRDLATMHNPDTAQAIPQVMANLEVKLTRAYLRYAAGQRFGFTTPAKLFGKANYDIELEKADSTFIKEALDKLGSKKDMLDFLASVEPQDSAYAKLKLALANDSTPATRTRKICNMERLRWRDKKHPENAERYVFVNIAAQQVWGIGPDSVINMKICCGKPATKSPLLSSEIHKIELNPEWGIPQSIIRGEMSHRAGDASYFARRNYYITDGTGKNVDPSTITPEQLRSGRYAIRQRSGAGNALGRIIFRFNNKFSVYLHDTSSPGAFNNSVRTISHGCIRLQRPFDMAEFILAKEDPWVLDQMRMSIDRKPVTQQGIDYKKTHKGAVRLIKDKQVEPKVPVVINYFTEYPNPKTGEIDVWGDPYGYDKILSKALKPFLP